MLTNYDAKAVADVMGLAFLRRPPVAARTKGQAADVIATDDSGAVLMIDAGARARRSDDAPAPASAALIERAVEHGLPRTALRHVAESLAGGSVAQVAAVEWSVVPKTTLERRQDRLSPQESERTERIARLFVHARQALGSEAEARAFMTTPHPELDGRAPMAAARTDLGTRRVERILTALEYGLAL